MTKRIILAALLLLATLLLYFLGKPKPEASGLLQSTGERVTEGVVAPIPSAPSGKSGGAGADIKEGSASMPATSPPAAMQSGSAPATDSPPASEEPEGNESLADVDPALDVEEVRRMVRGFRDALGENPIGTNSEITRALTGGNLKQVKMPVPRGSNVSDGGELVDRWGMPYFFHQLSAEEIEIRSAGPDRVMWTDDDYQVN